MRQGPGFQKAARKRNGGLGAHHKRKLAPLPKGKRVMAQASCPPDPHQRKVFFVSGDAWNDCGNGRMRKNVCAE